MKWILRPLMALMMLFARVEAKVLPVSWLFAMGRASARLMMTFLPGMRRSLMDNARYLLGPQSTRAERRKLGVDVLKSFGRFFVEMLTAPKTYPTPEEFQARMQGRQHGEEARALGKGVIAITLHMGNYELGPMMLGQLYDDVAVVYHRDPYGLIESMRSRKRRDHKVQEIATDGSPLFGIEVLKVLRRNGFALVAGDVGFAHQKGGDHPFLGGTARFLDWPARLAIASGAPLLPCFMVRESDGRYSLRMERAIFPGEGDAVASLMERLVPIYEDYVRRYPEQWLILHHYWPKEAQNPLHEKREAIGQPGIENHPCKTDPITQA